MSTAFERYGHEHPDADLLLIEPELEEESLFFSNIFSFANRRGVCELAYASTRRHLLRDFDRLAPLLDRHGLTLRRDVLEDQTRRVYDDVPDDPPNVAEQAGGALEKLEEALRRIA